MYCIHTVQIYTLKTIYAAVVQSNNNVFPQESIFPMGNKEMSIDIGHVYEMGWDWSGERGSQLPSKHKTFV